jgi:hypothetical protein
MQHARPAPKPRWHDNGDAPRLRRLGLAALATLAIAPAASAAATVHELKLGSTIFAAQVGSTATGGSVYAGALVDPKLGHGATVYSTDGTTSVRVIFHDYLPLGSISGTGRVTVVPGASSGPATFTGALKVNGGTGPYNRAHGNLAITGTIDSTDTTMATIRGTVTY